MAVLAACLFTACDGGAMAELWKDELGNGSGSGSDPTPPPAPGTYTVSFNANGGEGTMTQGSAEEGKDYTIPSNGFTAPAGTLRSFENWNTNADGTGTKYAEGTIPKEDITKDITLYAQWTKPSFSVSTDKKVYFSKGNLQATIDKDGKPTAWKFAENQYDYLGTGGANKTIGSAAGDIDLFGWVGTSGALNEYGISTSTTSTDYGTSKTETLKKDWGTAIDNAGTWRTLSKDEWVYLLKTRTSSTIGGTENARFAKVKVAGKAGILLFPDVFEWTGDMGTAPANCNTKNTDWTAVTDYTTALFEEMEKAGVVFLPAAGGRYGSSVNDVGSYGYYWSATPYEFSSGYAYHLYFYDGNVNPAVINGRYGGRSVRLVCGE